MQKIFQIQVLISPQHRIDGRDQLVPKGEYLQYQVLLRLHWMCSKIQHRRGLQQRNRFKEPQISSQNHGDVKGKAVMNSDACTSNSHAINNFSTGPAPDVHSAGRHNQTKMSS